jgi:alkylation response protein AidB-like acyl-CoA dehydrogenase
MSDVELDDMRAGLRKLLDIECTSDRVRAAADTDDGLDRALWSHLAEAGWTSLGVSEDHGGGGGTVREIAVVCEEVGRVVGPTLLSLTVGVSGPALSNAGTRRSIQLAEQCASGDTIVVPAITAPDGAPDPSLLSVSVTPRDDGFALQGTVAMVLEATAADVLIVAARDADGAVGLYLIDASDAAVVTHRGIDVTRRLADVVLDDVFVATDGVLHAAGPAGAQAHQAMVCGALRVLTAESRGGQSELLRRTVEHAKVRHQFNRPIGSFQAIKHRLADIYVDEHTSEAALHVSLTTDEDLEIGGAKAHVTEAFCRAAAEALQIHGGIGYTWEHDVHLFLKRAELNAALFGSARWHTLRGLADVVARANDTDPTDQNRTTHDA